MRILYLPCHSSLEWLEVKMFHELGHDVFSPGAYFDPRNPVGDLGRPPIDMDVDPEIVQAYHAIGRQHPGLDAKEYLTTDFLKRFDVMVVAWLPQHFINNAKAVETSKVAAIWRTIGQSQWFTEKQMGDYRHLFKVVRYSPKEREIPCFIGEDAMIRFYVPDEEFGGWEGGDTVITTCQNIIGREAECNYRAWEDTTRNYKRLLIGPHNGEIVYAIHASYEELKYHLRHCAAFMNLGTKPASYTLGFMMAWATGAPLLSIGPKRGNGQHPLFEIHELIEDGVTGFVDDDTRVLAFRIQQLLDDPVFAKQVSESGQKAAQRYFGQAAIYQQWQEFLNAL